VSCHKAAGVAEKMKEIFQDKLELQVHRTDSMEALPYKLRSSTSVFINDELVPIDVALEVTSMEKYITALL
jgi:hypothetical protein